MMPTELYQRGLEPVPALAGSWHVVPAMLTDHGCCGITVDQVRNMVDS